MKYGQDHPKMINQKFGRLLILSYDKEMSKLKGRDQYQVRCDCGIEKVQDGNSLRTGHVKSCGCLNREVASELRKQQIGENSHGYIFGFCCTKHLYEQWRFDANYECQRCGKTQEENGRKLDVHHKDRNHDNNDPKNIEVLCRTCHKKQRSMTISS